MVGATSRVDSLRLAGLELCDKYERNIISNSGQSLATWRNLYLKTSVWLLTNSSCGDSTGKGTGGRRAALKTCCGVMLLEVKKKNSMNIRYENQVWKTGMENRYGKQVWKTGIENRYGKQV